MPSSVPASSNSEIYNHQQIRDTKLAGIDLHSRSDSAIVGAWRRTARRARSCQPLPLPCRRWISIVSNLASK